MTSMSGHPHHKGFPEKRKKPKRKYDHVEKYLQKRAKKVQDSLDRKFGKTGYADDAKWKTWN